jgi:hypothetical protein
LGGIGEAPVPSIVGVALLTVANERPVPLAFLQEPDVDGH